MKLLRLLLLLMLLTIWPEGMNHCRQFPPVHRIESPLISVDSPKLELFPLPEKIKPQYQFWKKVFSEYNSRQALIHDNWYLEVVYEIVTLETEAASSQVAWKAVAEQAAHYRKLLAQMADYWDEPARMSAEERQLRRLFEGIPENPGHPKKLAAQRIRVQSGKADHLRQGISRSGKHLDMIQATFAEHGLPENLKYLPIIESMFNTFAVSHAGAVGMWQIMPATGKGVGLKIAHPIDERRDPQKATLAAAKILRENHARLNSWPLAITAYNHGLNGIITAVNSVGSSKIEDIIAQYRGPRFHFASRNFYVEFLAAMDICSQYERYFGPIAPEPSAPFLTIMMPDNLPASVLTDLFQIPLDQLRTLNPALHRTTFAAKGVIPQGYPLKLPPADGKKLITAFHEIIPRAKPAHAPKTEKYVVKAGDTLSQIAAQNGVTVAQMLRWNQIRNPNELEIGQALHIPLTRLSRVQARNYRFQDEAWPEIME